MTKIYDNSELREMTAAEENQLLKDSVAAENDHIAIESAYNKKVADKSTGNQKLKDLGLTDDEISALTG